MKKLLLALLLGVPFLAHAQSVPQMDRRVTLAGPTGLNSAFQTKADVNHGTLNGAVIDNASTWGGTTWATINSAIACLTTPQCIVSTAIKYSPSWAQATERSLEARLMDQVSVLDFDPIAGDGSHDATSALKNAIYAVCAPPGGSAPWGSGGKVYLPPGVYNISAVKFPCNGVTLEGANNGNVNSGSLDYRGTVIHLTTPDNTSAFAVGMVTADYGGGIHIRHMGIDGAAMSSSATVIDYSWLQHSTVEDIVGRNITNFYRQYGGGGNSITDLDLFGFSGTGIEFAGGPCSGNLASCNTRADLLRVSRVVMNSLPGYTSTCFAYHGLAQSLDVNNAVCESAAFGINAYCDTTAGNNGEACPAFARFWDFEAEDCTTCINASDIQDWEFFGGYYLGRGTSSTHVVNIWSNNYGGNWSSTAAGSYAQAVRFHGGRFGNAGGSVMYVGISQVVIEGAQFFSSNLSDSNKSVGAPNIEISATGSTTTPTQGLIHDNILCVASGQQPVGLYQGGVWLGAGVTNFHVHDNVTNACAGPTTAGAVGITDNSGNTTNMISNNG